MLCNKCEQSTSVWCRQCAASRELCVSASISWIDDGNICAEARRKSKKERKIRDADKRMGDAVLLEKTRS